MGFWNLLLVLAAASTVGSGISYAMAARISVGASSLSAAKSLSHRKALGLGRLLMAASLALLLAASAGLLSMFLRHDFSYEYVARNSSRGLENIYIVSAFWAGQEGSLLLWGMLSAVFGCLLMLTAKKHEDTAMPWYALAQAMLLLVVIRMTPFTMLADVPADGAGLNPLLMNPWMAIHPPIIFAGYAAIAVPYALAMSTLTKKEYSSWVGIGTWWNLVAWLLLGAGIMIGARWAYAVLGWGGYWGWDPVENASLVPWLFGAVLLHTFLSQKARGKMVRTNIALAIVTYLLIGYGSFLTRSGVLSDFSVHSFSDLGITSYLLLFILATGVPAMVLYVMRFRSMTASRKYQEVYERFTSRDFGIFAGASVLLASALITLLGTSAPILTRITGNPQAVDTSFYNITNYPLGVLIAILMGMFPLFKWGLDELKSAKAGLVGSIVLSAAGTAAVMLAGARGAYYLIFMFASFFGLFSNLYMFARTIKNGIKHVGSYLTHLGVALVFAGIITTGGWALTERVAVSEGARADVAGITIEVATTTQSADGLTTIAPLTLIKDGKEFFKGEAYMQKTRMNSIIRHPMIYSVLWEDIYVSPLTIQGAESVSALHGDHLEVKKGTSVSSGSYSVTFSSFDLTEMNSGKVGAAVKVEEAGSALFEGVLYYSIAGTAGSDSYTIFEGSGGKYRLSIEGIDASSGTAYLDLAKASEQSSLLGSNQILLEVSRKPMVWLLWIGAVLVMLGTAIAAIKRKAEAR